jgi:hypothetical protein
MDRVRRAPVLSVSLLMYLHILSRGPNHAGSQPNPLGDEFFAWRIPNRRRWRRRPRRIWRPGGGRRGNVSGDSVRGYRNGTKANDGEVLEREQWSHAAASATSPKRRGKAAARLGGARSRPGGALRCGGGRGDGVTSWWHAEMRWRAWRRGYTLVARGCLMACSRRRLGGSEEGNAWSASVGWGTLRKG